MGSAVQLLIRELYRPFEEVPDLVRCFGEAALALTESHLAEIVLRVLEEEIDLQVCAGGGERYHPTVRSSRFPICYQATELGGLTLLSRFSRHGAAAIQVCEWIAKSLAYHLKRYEVSRLARERHRREVVLIGTSEPLAQIDRFVERASQAALPALIMGSRGSEIEGVALALHLMGPCREEPFVQAHCATFDAATFEHRLLSLVHGARGGTLLLTHLEDLDVRNQCLLCHILEIGLASWADSPGGQPVAVRLLATAQQSLEEKVRDGEFYFHLLDQLDFLRLEVEPLRNRREDIRPLLTYFLRRHACGHVPEVSGEVLEACVEYDWPGDLLELSRLTARLAIMAEDGWVLPEHVRAYAPQILETRNRSPQESPQRLPTRERMSPVALREGLLPRVETCHPSLQKAIGYIATHYQRRLSLAEVAVSVYVSRSHLAHLFQQDLGTSFVRFLTSLRIDRAKRLLSDQPWEAITTIATETGFSDLRHFERTFKKEVGCSPKSFRSIFREVAR